MTHTALRPIPPPATRASDNVPMERLRQPASTISDFWSLFAALLITGLGLVGVLLLIGLSALRLVGVL